jgi:hypothetical protein
VLHTEGAQRAVGLVLDHPRALLPAPKPRVVAGGLDAREPAPRPRLGSPVMVRLHRVVEPGRRHAGTPVFVEGRDETALRDAVQRLHDLTPVHERTVNALTEYQRAGSGPRRAKRPEGADRPPCSSARGILAPVHPCAQLVRQPDLRAGPARRDLGRAFLCWLEVAQHSSATAAQPTTIGHRLLRTDG